MNIKNPILEAVFNYYDNKKNYLSESINEEDYCMVVDDRMFGDIMDMVQKGVFEEMENGHILIPTMGSYTFNITPDDTCYVDDENGNEYEANIDDTKLQQILQTVNSSKYKMVSESANNPFTKFEVDPETKFVKVNRKPNVPDGETAKAVHQAVAKSNARKMSREDNEATTQSLSDRRNDREYMSHVKDYWNNRNDNMAEPHGFGTSGTKPLFHLDEMDDNSVYDLANDEKGDKAQFAAKGMGYINEKLLHTIVNKVIKNKLK